MLRLILIAALSTSSASAQTIVDGSGQDIKKHRLESVIKATADLFKDPESVRFRKIVSKYKSILVCGEVNAKNSYGAYTGYTEFMFSADGPPRLLSPVTDKYHSMHLIVFKSCHENEAGEVKDIY